MLPGVALAAIVRLTVACVALFMTRFEALTSELPVLTTIPEMKLLPASVTGTTEPAKPLEGVIEVRVGEGGTTLKLTVPVVPADVVTLTVAAPSVAFAAIVKVAVICVALSTAMFETAIPGLLTAIAALELKFVPLRVTETLAPGIPFDGLIEDSVGVGAVTVNAAGALLPPRAVDTVMLSVPRTALDAMPNVAVIWVALFTLTLLTVMSGVPALTVAPEAKLVPLIVTGTVAPGVALAGLMEEIAGAGVPIVKVAGGVTPPGVVSTTFAVAGLALAET